VFAAIKSGEETLWCMNEEIGDCGEAAQNERHPTREEASREQHTADSFDKPGGNPKAIRQLSEHRKHLLDILHMRKIN